MIHIEKQCYNHSGGTKDYDLFLATCEETGMSALIRRWGRVGAFGQVKCEVFSDTRGKRELMKQERARSSHGYSCTDKDTRTVASIMACASFLGPIWSKTSGELKAIFDGVEMGDVNGGSSPLDDIAEPASPKPAGPRPEAWGSW